MIGIPRIDKDRLLAEVSVGGVTQTIWYSVEEKYAEYLCSELSDSFLINLLPYAMTKGYDVKCLSPISERLYYMVSTYLLPVLAKEMPATCCDIRIKADLSTLKFHGAKAVGASVSGGVDSFYTIYKHLNRAESSYNITHLCFYNAGACEDQGHDMARVIFKRRSEKMREVCAELKKEMVCIDSNVNELFQTGYEAMAGFRTLAFTLALQKLFSVYIFASGGEYRFFRFNPRTYHTYDLLTIPCFSTQNTEFVLSGAEASRTNKIEFIARYPVVRKYLNVCTVEAHNCCRCEKCIRTMLALYAVNELDNFKAIFNVDYFKSKKHEFFRLMMALRKWSGVDAKEDWDDNYQLLKRQVTFADRIGGVLIRWYRQLRRIIYRTQGGRIIYQYYVRCINMRGLK